MTKIVIEIVNSHDALLLIEFAKRLNGVVQINEEPNQMAQSAFAWLAELANVNAFEAVEDVVEWQTLQRQDRILLR